jgi:hypothetical protein
MTVRRLDHVRFVTRHYNDLQGLRYLVPLGLIALSAGGTRYFASWRPLLEAAFILGAFLLMFRAGSYYRRTFGEVEPQPSYDEELESLSFSPVGPVPRLAGFRPVTPFVRHALSVVGLAFALFFVFQAITPTVRVEEGDSVGKHYRITLDSVVEAEPSWTRGIKSIIGGNMVSPSTAGVVGGQMMLALCGSFFLGLWSWRERRRSQQHLLALGALLLGLSAFGTCLGYLIWEDRAPIVLIINLLLPILVHPWVALLLCGSTMILAGLLDHRQIARVLRPALEEPA